MNNKPTFKSVADAQRAIEHLEKRLSVEVCNHDCTVADAQRAINELMVNQCTPAERAVLDAMATVPEWVLRLMVEPEDLQDARPYYVALGTAELARRFFASQNSRGEGKL
jgi:hypothetical protein